MNCSLPVFWERKIKNTKHKKTNKKEQTVAAESIDRISEFGLYKEVAFQLEGEILQVCFFCVCVFLLELIFVTDFMIMTLCNRPCIPKDINDSTLNTQCSQ